MFPLADIRAILFCTAVILLVGCAAPAVQDKRKPQTAPALWRERVAGILQPGWETVGADNSVVITRTTPVTYYNPIALPPPGELRTKLIERSRRTESYQITLDIVERLPEEKYEELKSENAKTEKELADREDRMRSFAGKGDYMPQTPADTALYKEYRDALMNLPYHRLPDLYDEKHSIYVRTTRHPWSAFYSAREELECRAVLENIYSQAEVYEGKKSIHWPPGAEHARVAVFEAFESRRAYDRYLHKREMNLTGQR
jgi:hypothetical protein